VGRYRGFTVGVICSLALLLTGCGTAKGAPTAQEAATVFLSAAASGDVARAQSVSARPVSVSDLATLSNALFGDDASRGIAGLDFTTGFEVIGERLPTTYLVLTKYTAGGTKQWPPADDPAVASSWGSTTERYQIGLRKQGASWLVVTWTGPSGVTQ
jgi:hypothetical protein